MEEEKSTQGSKHYNHKRRHINRKRSKIVQSKIFIK